MYAAPITSDRPSFGQRMFDLLDQDRMLGRGRVQPEGDVCQGCDGELDEGAWCPRCKEAVL